MTPLPHHQAGSGKDVGYLQRARRLCCEWAVNYPEIRAACLETGLLGASEVVKPRGVHYSPTLLILHCDSCSLETEAKNSVYSVRNNGQPSALWGRRNRVEAFIRSGREK